MSLQLYVKLQAPTIELAIEAKDASKAKDKFIAGFKRYEIKETRKKFEEYQELLNASFAIVKQKSKASEKLLNDSIPIVSSSDNPANKPTFNEDEIEEAITTFIMKEIVYLKNVEVNYLDESGKEVKLNVADTRQIKPVDNLWVTSEDCLTTLLLLYLASAPYRSSISSAMQKALLNNDYEEAEIKN